MPRHCIRGGKLKTDSVPPWVIQRVSGATGPIEGVHQGPDFRVARPGTIVLNGNLDTALILPSRYAHGAIRRREAASVAQDIHEYLTGCPLVGVDRTQVIRQFQYQRRQSVYPYFPKRRRCTPG